MSPTPEAQLVIDLPHRIAASREDFLVAACNRAAVGWIDRWPEWSELALAVHGPAGCGKTHLARVWQARSGAVQVPVNDLRAETLDADAALARQVLIDFDADRCLPRAAERGLLHLYNRLREEGGHLLLCHRGPPARWTIELPDLASRLSAMPAVAIADPDDSLLAAVLLKQFADRQIAVEADLIAYLVRHMERSFVAARTLVAALDKAALSRRRPVTIPLARETLAALAPEPPR
jgi:chromosomal replication initiation ATPase DnaA